jgi:hypothetical protein
MRHHPTPMAKPEQEHARLDADQLLLKTFVLIACDGRDH